LPVPAQRVGPRTILVNIDAKTTPEAIGGLGMNGCRSKARRLPADPNVTCVVVERKDRLGRMNVELVVAALPGRGNQREAQA
jgi:putative resolvase